MAELEMETSVNNGVNPADCILNGSFHSFFDRHAH